MNLIDFLKDKLSYSIVYFLNTIVILIIMYLTLSVNKTNISLENILYGFLISIVLYTLFMVYEFVKIFSFNKQLGVILNAAEEDMEKGINLGAPETKEEMYFKKVYIKLYKFFEDKFHKYEEEHKEYIFFINKWVHQMKTPVSVIRLILQDSKEDNIEDTFKSIDEENDKIYEGLNIMLYNARINEFNHDFNVEKIDIFLLAREIINENKKSLIYNSIYPKINGKSIIIESDKKWIYFVINQILINAIKYTKIAEREKKIIELNFEEDEKKVILNIKDNGIGIPIEDQKRIFNAFFTGKNGRKASQSTGMGLYLSKRILNELGHDINVFSEEGKGTQFHIIFYKGKNIYKI